MASISFREAVSRGLKEALDEDDRVFIMGEDIGAYGGSYAVTKGFLARYGEERVRDTPIAESVVVGAGVGAALGGLRPIVEIMTINFSLLAMDQIINHAAKLRYMSGGQLKVPLIIRTVTGGGAGLGATHSQCFEYMYASIPGLKVVVPCTPYDALGLFRTAIKDDNSILFAEHALLYGTKGEVPEERYAIPFGVADIKRKGRDITLVSYGRMVHVALAAAEELAKKGIEAEVVDLRTLRPWDVETVVKSVKRTGKAVVVEETWRTGGFGAEVASQVQEEAFDHLDAPISRVGAE
ncbi:MAG: alpha-ketoacid dehydrogenase subunit beta, partial [Chloroflexi bacterium]|nr:alpha-ketoacid dehydrogenase subunit beta [Chloroflexota bacterium]